MNPAHRRLQPRVRRSPSPPRELGQAVSGLLQPADGHAEHAPGLRLHSEVLPSGLRRHGMDAGGTSRILPRAVWFGTSNSRPVSPAGKISFLHRLEPCPAMPAHRGREKAWRRDI
jgi:hypothetical protein